MKKTRQEVIDRIQELELELEGGATPETPETPETSDVSETSAAGTDILSLMKTLSPERQHPIAAGARAVSDALSVRAGITPPKREKMGDVSELTKILLRDYLERNKPAKAATSLQQSTEALNRARLAQIEESGETGFGTIEEAQEFSKQLGLPISSARREKGRVIATFGQQDLASILQGFASEPAAPPASPRKRFIKRAERDAAAARGAVGYDDELGVFVDAEGNPV